MWGGQVSPALSFGGDLKLLYKSKPIIKNRKNNKTTRQTALLTRPCLSSSHQGLPGRPSGSAGSFPCQPPEQVPPGARLPRERRRGRLFLRAGPSVHSALARPGRSRGLSGAQFAGAAGELGPRAAGPHSARPPGACSLPWVFHGTCWKWIKLGFGGHPRLQAPGPAGRGRWLRAPPGALREGSPAFRPWGAGCPAGTGGSLLTSHDCERRTPVSGASSGKPGRVSSRAPPWFRGAPGGSQPPGSQPSPSPLLSSRLWSRSDFRPSPEPESLCMWVLSTIYHIATD